MEPRVQCVNSGIQVWSGGARGSLAALYCPQDQQQDISSSGLERPHRAVLGVVRSHPPHLPCPQDRPQQDVSTSGQHRAFDHQQVGDKFSQARVIAPEMDAQ